MLVNPVKPVTALPELFDLEPDRFGLPPLENRWLDNAFDEIELLGFPLCAPFELLDKPVRNRMVAAELALQKGKTVEIVGYLVSVKNTRTSDGERMYFGTFIDLDGDWIDTVHFPSSARQYPFNGPGCYRIIGKVMEEYGFIFIDVAHQYRLPVASREKAHPRTLTP